MVRNCKRPCKDCAGLALLTFAVSKKNGIFCRKLLSQSRTLADEAFGYYCTIYDFGAAAGYKILCEDVGAYIYRVIRGAVERAILESGDSFD